MHSNDYFGVGLPRGCCSTAGMCWAQQEPGFTLLLVTAQHSCGMQASSSPRERPSPHPSPAPASSPSPGGDKAPKPGAPKPGAPNPAAAYAGKGLLQHLGVFLPQGRGFLCDVSSLRAVQVGAGGGEGPSRSCLLFHRSPDPVPPREVRLGGIKPMLCGLEFSLLSVFAFSPSILFSL